MNIVLVIAIGGFFGAIARFGLSKWLNRQQGSSFPIGTFLANVSGSILLGTLFGIGIEGNYFALLAVGFLGSLTTFSTIFIEFITLVQNNKRPLFYAYLLTTYLLGMLGALIGFVFGRGMI